MGSESRLEGEAQRCQRIADRVDEQLGKAPAPVPPAAPELSDEDAKAERLSHRLLKAGMEGIEVWDGGGFF